MFDFLKRLLGIEKMRKPAPGSAPTPVVASPSRPTAASGMYFIKGTGRFRAEVVGESHYQANLARICGPRKKDGENKLVTAHLILDDANAYDNQAVRVEISGLVVGHLAREFAPKYRAYLKRSGQSPAVGQCGAKIKGGWKRGRNDIGSYGVSLDLPAM